jgi:hypothetical protein
VRVSQRILLVVIELLLCDHGFFARARSMLSAGLAAAAAGRRLILHRSAFFREPGFTDFLGVSHCTHFCVVFLFKHTSSFISNAHS